MGGGANGVELPLNWRVRSVSPEEKKVEGAVEHSYIGIGFKIVVAGERTRVADGIAASSTAWS